MESSETIGLGHLEDLDEILLLTRACGSKMRAYGIDQWDENYPSREILENDIRLEQLFVLRNENQILGIIVLNQIQDDEYELMTWTNMTQPFIVVHRLAVDPVHQGKGLAKKLMEFAEDWSRKKNFTSIRLDTFSQNPRNQRFYENRGYEKLGEVFLKYKKEYPYYCYEYLLK